VGVGGGAEVAEFALAGGSGEKAKSHAESVMAVGFCSLCGNAIDKDGGPCIRSFR
jgi:hypothetical protein